MSVRVKTRRSARSPPKLPELPEGAAEGAGRELIAVPPLPEETTLKVPEEEGAPAQESSEGEGAAGRPPAEAGAGLGGGEAAAQPAPAAEAAEKGGGAGAPAAPSAAQSPAAGDVYTQKLAEVLSRGGGRGDFAVPVTRIKLLHRMLLLGPPGVGKTEIIKQLAMEEARAKGKKFIDLRTATEEEVKDVVRNPQKYYVFYRIPASTVFPEDIEGVPKLVGVREGEGERRKVVAWFTRFFPNLVITALSHPEVEGVLFIDELTNAQSDEQIAAMYLFIQEGELGWNVKLSPKLKVVAAANPQEWSEIARTLPAPLRSRLTIVHVSPPSVDDWIEYMDRAYPGKWPRIIAAFLKGMPQYFMKKPGNEEENFPTPRNWTELALALGQLLDEGASPELIESVIVGRLGLEVGTKLLGVLRLGVMPREVLDALAANPDAWNRLEALFPNKPKDALKTLAAYALGNALASGEPLEKYIPLMERMAGYEPEWLMAALYVVPPEKRGEIVYKLFKTSKQMRNLLRRMANYLPAT